MLKTRILSALLLIPLCVLGLFKLNADTFAGLTGLLFLQALFEWGRLLKLPARQQVVYLLVGGCLGLLGLQTFGLMAAGIMTATWALMTLLIAAYPRSRPLFEPQIVGLLLGYWTVLPSFWALNHLRQVYGPSWVIFGLSTVWIADTGAYFAGRRFGRHSLNPVSPGKTWEGVLGALLATSLWTGLGGQLFDVKYKLSFSGMMLGLVVASIAGDLLESLYKRLAGVKDSGALIPGHGGLFDRIDSLTAALPIFLYISLRFR